MSQGIVCPVCHSSNRSHAKFCAHCGAALAVSAPAPQRLQPSALVHNGGYRVVRSLNKGGMGMIYLAQDLGAFDRLCVIKEMIDYFDPANPQEVQEAQQRFEDEARTLARLTHPQIPNLLSYFSERQHNYIVMAYVEGVTLDHFIGKQQATVQVVEYGIQACEILEYLGGLNPPVVHHDIKPANIIVDNATKSAWLVDFGVAKARLAMQQNGQVGVKKSSIFGTTGYAPQEQYQGQSEPKSDVHALAATLYHVLTGDDPQLHPFSFPQVAALPAGLASALEAALTQDVRRRCTAADLRQALENALRTPAPRKPPSAPLPAVSPHESYAVIVTQPIADSDRAGMVRFLQQELGLSALEAEVLTWQAPARYLRGIDRAQAQVIGQKLKARGAAGVSYLTSQLPSWRQRLSPAEQKQLAGQGATPIYDKRLPQDRLCHCHRCHHEWKTQARDQSTLPELCPQCRQQWYPHRIFRCAICGHEFVHSDLVNYPTRLFAACPACKSAAWQPGQQIHFARRQYTVKLDPAQPGVHPVQSVSLAVAGEGTGLCGRVTSAAPWVQTAPDLHDARIALAIDTRALAVRQLHATVVEIIANAGVAQIAVEAYVVAPPAVVAAPLTLDFGVVRANETRTLKLDLRNVGEQVLSGQITCADAWASVDKATFAANQHVVRCTVRGDRLKMAGVNTTMLVIDTNGGVLTAPVRAEALPTTLAVTPHVLDFGVQRRRHIVQQPLVVENIGIGRLAGTLHSNVPWLVVEDASIRAEHTQIAIQIDTGMLEPGQHYAGAVRIASNGGEVEVPVTVQIAPRRLAVLGWLAKIGLPLLFVAMIGVGWRWGQTLTGAPVPITPAAPQAAILPAPVSPTPAPLPSRAPSATPAATATPSPTSPTVDSLPFLDGLRTLVAQSAALTATWAATPETVFPETVSPTPATLTPTAQPARCLDDRAVITAPAPGQSLRGVSAVYGVAEHAAFRYYKIELAPAAGPEERFSFVARGDAPVASGLLAVIDTTHFANGAYILQLTVVDRTGNFPAPCRVPVILAN